MLDGWERLSNYCTAKFSDINTATSEIISSRPTARSVKSVLSKAVAQIDDENDEHDYGAIAAAIKVLSAAMTVAYAVYLIQIPKQDWNLIERTSSWLFAFAHTAGYFGVKGRSSLLLLLFMVQAAVLFVVGTWCALSEAAAAHAVRCVTSSQTLQAASHFCCFRLCVAVATSAMAACFALFMRRSAQFLNFVCYTAGTSSLGEKNIFLRSNSHSTNDCFNV